MHVRRSVSATRSLKAALHVPSAAIPGQTLRADMIRHIHATLAWPDPAALCRALGVLWRRLERIHMTAVSWWRASADPSNKLFRCWNLVWSYLIEHRSCTWPAAEWRQSAAC